MRDDILHIRIDSDLKEAFFQLATQRGMFASQLLIELMERALAEDAELCTQLSRTG